MKKIQILLFIFILTFKTGNSQLVVDTNVVSPSNLLTAITAAGIAVSNISYTGDSLAASTFYCNGGCNLGIPAGIILTSGHASVAAEPNTGAGQGVDVGLGNDTDLDALTTSVTFDKCVLEFDFIALSDTAQFNYIFASEEYSEYVNSSFNDVFGFFISGPGINGVQNIALIPGTSTPIAINNVNNGPSTGIPTGPCMNCTYFLDNIIDTFTTAYDGLTTVLTATAANIQPGQTYHLKLAVADVADHIYDTGVFLQEGSFRIACPPAMFVGGNRNNADTIHICQNGSVSLSAPAGFSYLWNTGDTTQSITVSMAGAYNVAITGYNNSFTVNSPVINFVVDNTPIPVPTLSFANNFVSSSVNSNSYTYSWTFNGSPVLNSDSSSTSALQYGCYEVTIQDAGGCYSSSNALCLTSTGISENLKERQARLFPNPFGQTAMLTFENPNREKYSFRIYDVTGRERRSIDKITNDHIVIEKNSLGSGVYFYELFSTESQSLFKGKLIVN